MTTRLTTPMRSSGSRAAALLAGLTLAAALSACGSDDGGNDSATDPAASSTPSETPSQEPSETDSAPASGSGAQTTIDAIGSAGVTEATLVSQTEGGGTASTMAFALDTDQAVSDFTMELENGFGDTVAATVEDVAKTSTGATPYGAIVSVGCEAPRGVAIDQGEAGFEVVPKLPKSNVQCLAPMTYVVVFAAPDA